jgi:predicted RNA-binding Zn-ribbon protein involved in translation (DUF1610 family)
MRLSSFACANCGSSNLRRSRRHSTLDVVQMLFGNYRLRCLDCNQRFSVNLLFSKAVIAKCPRCLNIKLDTWDPKHYRVPLLKKLLIALGGHRYRCNSCRYNFVSFRPPGAARKR